MKILVTGGTIFLSKCVVKYFLDKKDIVYTLNRGNNLEVQGAIQIKADRHNLADILKNYHFDVVLDITAYTKEDVKSLIEAIGSFNTYLLISSSAVYPIDTKIPFKEDSKTGYNSFWKEYGLNKKEAEEYVINNLNDYYIIRPPYLYGPENIVYRESFVFECAEKNLPFYVPKDGKMNLQFFYVYDLCKMIDNIINIKPENRIFNCGNKDIIDINTWVNLCYNVVGKKANIIHVYNDINERFYFPFFSYNYMLDTSKQDLVINELTKIEEGLKESYLWYKNNKNKIRKKPYLEYIENNLK